MSINIFFTHKRGVDFVYEGTKLLFPILGILKSLVILFTKIGILSFSISRE